MTTTGSGADPAVPGLGGVRAAAVFSAELRPRHGGRLRHAARIAGAFVSQLALGLLPSPDVHDIVVTRREDGAEVLRVPAGDPLVAGDLLASVRTELEQLDPEAFLSGWRTKSASTD